MPLNELKLELIVDLQWYQKMVAERHNWIDHTKDMIKWHEQELAKAHEHLEQEQQWLAEAIQMLEEYERTHHAEKNY